MKKTFFNILFTFFFLCGIYACTASKVSIDQNKGSEAVTTASGLTYEIYKHGTGIRAQKGDILKVHYVGKLKNDSIFDSSRERGEAFQFKLGAGQVIKGWEEAFAQLRVGDKATLSIPPALAYGKRAVDEIPPNSTLFFDVELLEVTAGVRPFNVQGKDTIQLPSGLKMIHVLNKASGRKAMKQDAVKVHYTGYLEDGSIFDSSVERGEAISFPLGTGRVIKGWDEGIAQMRVGEKARLIIPPHLAYGAKGYPPVIPEQATLIFDVELVAIED